MATLWYEALKAHDPALPVDAIASFVRGGINEFIQYLIFARRHLDKTAIRVAWQVDNESEPRQDGSVWVTLCDPSRNTDRFERDAKKFFADQVREVYEADPEDGDPRRARPQFVRERSIAIREVDENSGRLLLAREPVLEHLLLRPNTYPLHCQIEAMNQLRDKPSAEHLPLLRLLGPAKPKDGNGPQGREVVPVEWPAPETRTIDSWFVLTKNIEGVQEQRQFVVQALSSPDFAILEGPPGSGKTTVICELVMQLIERGKRVLLCASTHVAVDNVLERLKSETNESRDHVLAVRIGDRHNVSTKAQPYRLDEFTSTIRKQIASYMERQRERTPAQDEMFRAMRANNAIIERLVLQSANLVCGTTIGILQHPDIKARKSERRGVEAEFDVLIVDEASKTTFQEFLVPALWAKRWVLVGDPLQLSPYVEDEEVAANVQAGLPCEDTRNACLDVFDNCQFADDPTRWKPTAIVSDSDKVRELYDRQAGERGVRVADGDAGDSKALIQAQVIFASPKGAGRCNSWPADLAVVRGAFDGAERLRRRARAFWELRDRQDLEERTWEGEIAWRLLREYEQRVFERNGRTSGTSERYRRDRESLMPAKGGEAPPDRVNEHIESVRRIALPSVLESLQVGFGRRGPITPTTLTEGLPQSALAVRHTRLTYQRRMHPEISAFPREHVYQGQALIDPKDMATRRKWPGPDPWSYASRAVWIDVRTTSYARSSEEAQEIVAEIRKFLEWASRHPRADKKLWEIAVLTFYRAQERELRRAIRQLSGERREMQESILKHAGVPVATAHVCTVDRFQGHEADVVFLSVANNRVTSFLESPNRINVAVTRARYQLVVVGNRHAMKRCRTHVLKGLAESLDHDLRFDSSKSGSAS